jgi:two-component system, NarL family, nitrate/nitrite response regulator NarL
MSSPGAHVIVVDDVGIYRHALVVALSLEAEVATVQPVADAETALRSLGEEAGPQVVILDMAMTDSSGALSALVRFAPHVPVIAVAVSEADDEVIACAEAGVAGYVHRGDTFPDLLALISRVTKGETLCSLRVAATILRRVATLAADRPRDPAPVHLTAREREVLQLVDEGLSNKQIARRLSIELRTVKNHVHHILEKFQVHRRAEAAARFRAAQQRSVAHWTARPGK